MAEEQDGLGFSPNYGCAIGATAFVVFSTLIALTIYTGYRQNKEIDAFASPEPLQFEPEFSAPERVSDVRASLREFGSRIAAHQSASLSLSAQDLNDLLGHEERLMEIRDMIHFTDITDTLNARVSFPMKTLFRGGNYRYLNGTASFRPIMRKDVLDLEVPRMVSDRGEVPDGFVEIFSESNLLHPYRADEKIGPLFERITGARIEEGRVVLEFDASRRPPLDES